MKELDKALEIRIETSGLKPGCIFESPGIQIPRVSDLIVLVYGLVFGGDDVGRGLKFFR